MNGRSSVDVIVPCYNYGAYLETCLISILNQEDVDVRILLIDDGSSDASPSIARRLAASDARVTYRQHLMNIGHIATYNEGLDWAESDYVVLISADDILIPGALSRATRLLDAQPDAAMAHGREIVFSQQPELPADADGTSGDNYTVTPGRAFIEKCCAEGHNPVATPTAIVRTTVQKAAGAYDARLPHTADMEMWLRVAAHGAVIRLDSYQAFKRQHARNMQLQFIAAIEGDVRERVKAFEIFCDRDSVLGPDPRRLLAMAHRALALDIFWSATRAFDAGQERLCTELLALSRSICSEVVGTKSWRRMRIKQAFGNRLWTSLTSLATTIKA